MKKNIRVISNPAFIVFLGALISAFGGWWAYYKQESDGNKNQKELRDKDNEIIALQKTVIQTTNNQLAEQKELRKKSDQIAELNAQIAEAQKELIQQNKNTSRLISGEGSFCVIYILPTSKNQASIMVQQRGETALSGLKFSIMTEYDDDQLQTSLKIDSSLSSVLKTKSETGHLYDVGILGVGINRILSPMSYKWKKNNIFHINVMAINGAWIENFEYNNGQIRYRILKVEREENPNIKPKILEQEGFNN